LLALVYEQAGRYEDAIAEGRKAFGVSGGAPRALGVLGHAYALAGKRSEALKVLAELKRLSKQRYVAPLHIAVVYAGLGDKAQALEWLERAYQDPYDRLAWIKVEPQFDSLRGEPRFRELLRRMRLE
jgi:serine/threonine-protein kinase